MERHGAMNGRFRFFETFSETSEFYQRVAKPLFSMQTVGSIDVEGRIKNAKYEVLTKKRNCLLDPKGVSLHRSSENQSHLMKAKKILGKKITDSIV